MSEAAVQKGQGETIGLMINDVSRAYFYADSTEPTYVRLCPEDMGPGEESVWTTTQSDVWHKDGGKRVAEGVIRDNGPHGLQKWESQSMHIFQ